MRASPLSAIAVVALLVFAGCAGLPGTGGDPSPDASPDEFPNASAIDQSVFDRHATAMANTSFTLSTEKTRKDRVFHSSEKNFRHMNDTGRFLAEPSNSQYLVHTTGYFSGNGTIYSDGSTEYMLSRENNWSEVRTLSPVSAFNESSDRYLWRGLFSNDSMHQLDHAAIDATYEREGVETFQGVPVMRYEATGVDALADSWAGGENASSRYEEFSATLLLDEDGVIRHYEYEFVWAESATRRITQSYTLSDVGSTDVEKPDWAANATAES
ncbi:DUF7537 family lipoprotein [Halosolutus gelatinilyticus]|uniref:DUF7537 family lipoprotein n=1 Tax=Halosolutus gelatinilyticus TaxID=2931975 RepID=UPI001FF5C326|nr:hypothetical protein [Halosolutus gelatinilyticus]